MAEKTYKVHKTSFVGNNTVIGNGTRIWQFCNIMDGVEIGENCNVGMNVFMETGTAVVPARVRRPQDKIYCPVNVSLLVR